MPTECKCPRVDVDVSRAGTVTLKGDRDFSVDGSGSTDINAMNYLQKIQSGFSGAGMLKCLPV
jgi:hypothetical protein